MYYFRCRCCNFTFSGNSGIVTCNAERCPRRGYVVFIMGGYYMPHGCEFVRKM